jgi:hypothetical protein
MVEETCELSVRMVLILKVWQVGREWETSGLAEGCRARQRYSWVKEGCRGSVSREE